MPNPNQIPSARTAFLDPVSGLVTRVWFRFFENINTIVSGVYTPTLTNTTNITASTPRECQYLQVYDVVTVSGRVTIQATAIGACNLKMTLPVASTFTDVGQAGGTFATTTSGGTAQGGVIADTVGDKFEFRFVAANTVSTDYTFTVTYRIV